MIYYTGDIHGSPYRISRFAIHKNLTHEDIIVILGDVGANYFCDERDNICDKSAAKSELPSQLFSVLFVKGFGLIIKSPM